jgi:transcription initiation factor IIE alpha subunit
MSPYPPGISTRDLERAGIIDHEVHCPDCGAVVNRSENHEEWCDLKDADVDEVAELAAEERQAIEYDPLEHGDKEP